MALLGVNNKYKQGITNKAIKVEATKPESSYRDLKSDGWQWQRTRLTNPERAERHWLAMAVATLWMVTLGGEQEAQSHDHLNWRTQNSEFRI